MVAGRLCSRGKVIRVLLLAGLCVLAAAAQTTVAGKAPAFEVFSIRPSAPGTPTGMRWAPSPDGYHSGGQSIWKTIMIAYYPQGMTYWRAERLQGAPSWVEKNAYDIEAKVAANDLAEWQLQNPQHHDLLNEMLKTALSERCKLVLHRAMVDATVYGLMIGKRGVKLKESVPGAAYPADSVRLQEGGAMVPSKRGDPAPELKFYGVSMAGLAARLTGMGMDWPVQDMTGMAGKYDFVLRKREDSAAAEDGSEAVFKWDLAELGLILKPAKMPTETLVIDHIEVPSAN